MKEEILRVTAAFLHEGREKFTVDDIAAALKISKKTIYKYFDGKEQLAEEVFARIISGARAAQKEVLSGAEEPVSKQVAFLVSFMEIYRLDSDSLFRRYGLSRRLRERVKSAEEENWRTFVSLYAKAPSGEVSPDVLKTVVYGVLNEVCRQPERAEKAEACLSFVLRAPC